MISLKTENWFWQIDANLIYLVDLFNRLQNTSKMLRNFHWRWGLSSRTTWRCSPVWRKSPSSCKVLVKLRCSILNNCKKVKNSRQHCFSHQLGSWMVLVKLQMLMALGYGDVDGSLFIFIYHSPCIMYSYSLTRHQSHSTKSWSQKKVTTQNFNFFSLLQI